MANERYKFSLSNEIKQACIEKLNEPREDRDIHEAIDDLKQRFAEKYPALQLVRHDDVFLLRFLRSCEYNLALSVKTLGCYHKLRNEWRELFELIEDKVEVEKSLRKGAVVSLAGRAKDGSLVLLKRPGISGNQTTVFIASVVATYEKLLENEESQVYGFTVIAEMSHLSFRFGIQMASIAKRFVRMLQEVLPMRLQTLHVVNEAFVFDGIFAVASQFMKTRVREKIKLHKSNLDGLQEFIDESVLPPILGGSSPELQFKP